MRIFYYPEWVLPLYYLSKTSFWVTLEGNYPFRKALNLIRKYEGKQFSELRVIYKS